MEDNRGFVRYGKDKDGSIKEIRHDEQSDVLENKKDKTEEYESILQPNNSEVYDDTASTEDDAKTAISERDNDVYAHVEESENTSFSPSDSSFSPSDSSFSPSDSSLKQESYEDRKISEECIGSEDETSNYHDGAYMEAFPISPDARPLNESFDRTYGNPYMDEKAEDSTQTSSYYVNEDQLNGSSITYGKSISGGSGNSSPKSGSFRNRRGESKPINLTRRGFAGILIIAMLLTSCITFGGVLLYDRVLDGGSNTISNYKLTSSKETYSWESIINKAKDSVVSITTESMTTDIWMQNYVTKGAGSGVIISDDGYILTCNHVIEGAGKITIALSNNKTYSAKVVGRDPSNDVALLKVNATNLTAATYGDSSKLSVGSSVVAIGNPLGELGGTATTGIISALDRELTISGKKLTLLQTDASINPGNSGGGLFDASGNLVGIVVAKSSGSDVEGLGFAIPINKVAEIAKDLVNGKTPQSTTPIIGVTVLTVDESTAAQNGLPSAGVYVKDVTLDTAKKAGIKAGDMIYSVGKVRVSTTEELKSALSKYKVGDVVPVTIMRDNQAETVKVKLSNANS